MMRQPGAAAITQPRERLANPRGDVPRVVAPALQSARKRPRVLMVAEVASTHTHKWAKYFVDRGYDLTVVSESPGEVDGVKTITFPPKGAWWTKLPHVRFGGGWQRWLAGWLQWRSIVRIVKPDIVHVHYVTGEARDYFYYRGFKHLIVSTYGSDVVFGPFNPNRLTRPVVRRIKSLLRQATVVTTLSQFLENETRKFTAPDRAIRVITLGVDCDHFTPGARRDSGTSKAVALGFVKKLTRMYGPDVLLDAFALVNKERPATKLIFAGNGDMELFLRRRTTELGLSASVDFVGRIANTAVPELLRQLDIFVMPTIVHESFGVAAIEASACGLPVVASAVGGVPEAVVDGQTGLLVPPQDPAALAAACIKLIDEPAARRSMGEAGRRFVMSRYDWRNTAAPMRVLYDTIFRDA